MPFRVALLGPQRLRPTLASVVDELGIEGRIAAVTAGWQEREAEDEELRDHLGGRTVNLELYRRTEALFAADPELFAAHRRRQDRLRELQDLYRVRLDAVLGAARELLSRKGDSDLLERQREAAIEAVRRLDAEHVEAIAGLHREFDEEAAPDGRPALAEARGEVAERVAGCDALAVAGGHVAVLLNRLRLFALPRLSGQRPVLAWSAGAMALAERVVLFHDRPPQGAGNAEVLEAGLGVFPEVLPFPHARRRLRLRDPRRVALLARRMAPRVCVPLDEEARLDWDGRRWVAAPGTRRLLTSGGVAAWGAGPGGSA